MKKWLVAYDHGDGRYGLVTVMTELTETKCQLYGNEKVGVLIVDGLQEIFDLRYCRDKDLHFSMLKSYFGAGLYGVKELT